MERTDVRFLPLLAISILAWLCPSCASLKYSDDVGFLVSAQADSPEFPVFINGKICKDTDGIPGLCSKRIRSNEPLVIKMDPRPYAYTIRMACTKELGESQAFAVPKNAPFEHAIAPEKFSSLKSFICIGEIFPDDRDLPISAKWEFRAKVEDRIYAQRETPYIRAKGKKNYLVLGQYAKFSNVFDEGQWKAYKEKTIVEIKGDPAKVVAYSESFNCRFNSIGF